MGPWSNSAVVVARGPDQLHSLFVSLVVRLGAGKGKKLWWMFSMRPSCCATSSVGMICMNLANTVKSTRC